MRTLPLILLSLILLTGCAARVSCPRFPVPTDHVKDVLRETGRQDKEVWAWFNQLLDLCQQLGDCE